MTFFPRLALVGLVLALAACGDTAQSLGLGRNPPDEFAVVERPPLSMPPEFTLRPPSPGAPRPQEVSMPSRAQTLLFGAGGRAASSSESEGEKSLLAAAGTDKAEPNIRAVIDREAAQKVVGSEHLVEELLWWRDPSSNATTVDPAAEAARLREAQEKGESVTTGPTPIIEKNKSGWLGL